MTYDIKIYEPTATDPNFRFALGTEGSKTLFVIGLNPSTANDKEPDQTMRKVMGLACRYGCDSFIMFNLYSQRTTTPNNLHTSLDEKLHNENISQILTLLNKYNDISILAAWGETIKKRKYFKKCLSDIYNKTKNKKITWLKIGELTLSGHPRHPSRGAYLKLTKLDIEKYLLTIK